MGLIVISGGAAAPPSAQRMNKSGNVSPTSTSAVLMTGWTADGGYPATNIVSNQLVIDNGGTINVEARMNVSGNNFGVTVTGHIYKNGVSIKSASTSGTATLNLDIAGVSVGASDTIDMRVQCNSGIGGVTVSATGTYVLINPA